jgi:hypothetical protein
VEGCRTWRFLGPKKIPTLSFAVKTLSEASDYHDVLSGGNLSLVLFCDLTSGRSAMVEDGRALARANFPSGSAKSDVQLILLALLSVQFLSAFERSRYLLLFEFQSCMPTNQLMLTDKPLTCDCSYQAARQLFHLVSFTGARQGLQTSLDTSTRLSLGLSRAKMSQIRLCRLLAS